MKNTEDARRLPGLVPRICSAGRTVAAVVCTRAGHQAVNLALPEHHGADRDRVGEMLAGDLLGPALVPPQLGQRGDEPLGGGPRVQDADPLGQPQAQVPGLRGHLVRGTEQQAAGDAAAGAVGRGAERAGFGALGQDDERVDGAGLLHLRGREGLSRDRSQDAFSASAMVSVTASTRSTSSGGSPGSRSRTRVAVW